MSTTNDHLMEFTRHYEENKGPIFNYIFYRVGFNRDTAEDLTSEIFIKAFEHFDSYDRGRPFKTWIFTIAHNHLVNFFVGKKKILPLDEAREVPQDKVSAGDEFDHKSIVETLLTLTDKLPENQRELLIMRYINDLSNSEIAAVTNKAEGAVRTALSRAIEALRNAYNIHLSTL